MRFPIRLKLLAGFGIDLLLMLALGYFAVQQMTVMHASAHSVATHTIPSLAIVASFKEQVNAYRVNQLEYMLYTNTYDKERSLRRMIEVEEAMATQLINYRPLISSSIEQERFTTLEAVWQALVRANHQSFIPDALQNNTGTVRPFYSRMNPLYRDVENAITGLTVESRRQADESLGVVQVAYQTARNFIVADTVLVVLISTLIALVLSGRIAVRLRHMMRAAQKVAAGDLERTVVLKSRDELGQLADAFNLMVDGLRSQRFALEERNAALQISLARQEQLMADLVRQRQAEEEAQRAQATAEAANKAKSMFLATMSHELRTPLNAILGYAQILRLTQPSVANADLPDPLDRILAAGRHLTTLINNVLDFSKIEQGAIDLIVAEVPVRRLVGEAVDVVAPLIERQANTLVINCPIEPGLIQTDPGRVRQILINLLGNAAKFTEQGQITIHVWREKTPDLAQTQVVFAVEDTGIGIAPDQLERLFLPFSQVDESVTRRYEGTGLGLALSRQLSHALGGTLTVISQLGQGSTFTLRLPVLPVAGPSPSDRLASVTPEPFTHVHGVSAPPHATVPPPSQRVQALTVVDQPLSRS
ncbi:MAG: ATP-binding protein [Oscillochloridaceae bacterium umkhey_bin13]